MRIVVLEDDPSQAELLQHWLEKAGHSVQVFSEGKALLRNLANDTFDMLILDWMLPDIDGIEVLRKVRENMEWNIPILFVTARDEEQDIVTALEAGADDYMVKPIRSMELTARVGALGRRVNPQADTQEVLEMAPFTIDPSARRILRDGNPVELTHKEFDLALFLFRHTGRVLSRGYILESVWGRNPDINTRTVDTHISRLRNKLGLAELDNWKLSAIYLHGYRLERLDVPQQETGT